MCTLTYFLLLFSHVTSNIRLRKHVMAIVTAVRSEQIPEDETKDHMLSSLVLPIARES